MLKLPQIFVISDIHRDTGPFEWPEAARAADLILVAGDLSNGQFDIDFLCQPGKPLVFVPGNHDFWSKDSRDMFEMYRDMKQAAAGTNVHVLWDEEVQIDGVRILGTPLWTDFGGGNEELMRASFAHSRDYQYINAKSWYEVPENRKLHEARGQQFRGYDQPDAAETGAFTPVVALSLHQKSLAFIESKLDEPFEGPTILVTHMAPSYDCLRESGTIREHYLDPKHWHCRGRDNSDLARVAGYASDLSKMFDRYRTELDLAVHGHIHASLDIVCGSTRVLANPRGRYYGPLSDNALDCLFYGYTPRPEDIARSKARFEEYPYWGDNWEFQADSLVRLEDGLAPPLKEVVTRDSPRLQELVEQMRELEPFAAHEVPVIRQSIQESAVARAEEFEQLLVRALTVVASAFDVKNDTSNWWMTYQNLGLDVPRGGLVPRFEDDFVGDKSDPSAGMTSSIAVMTQLIEGLSEIPRAAELGRRKYLPRVSRAVEFLREQGYDPEWHPSTPQALWRKLYFNLGRISVTAPRSEIDKLSGQVDEFINENRIPRRAWVNVMSCSDAPDSYPEFDSKKGSW